MKILHITSHLGGGVGKILSSIAIKDTKNKHIILALQETKTTKFYDLCVQNDVEVYLADICDVEELCRNVDIIQLEWWHNPITMEFMCKYLQHVSCRLIIWSHVSGCNFPYISPDFAKLADKFIFSSQYSWDNPKWSNEDRAFIKSNSSVIVSTGVEETTPINKNQTRSFSIGYLGNLSYNKTYPETVSYYEEVAKEIDNINFIIAGDIDYGKEFVEDLKNSSVADRVFFSGYVNDIREEFAKYDVLSYLLRDDNFATAENALLEGMSFGVVPIVFKQTSEQYTVEHMKTGIVVSNLQEYKEAVLYLYNNPLKKKELSQNALNFVNNNMCIDNTIEKLSFEYSKVISINKSEHNFTDVFGGTAKEWFYTAFAGDIDNMTDNEKACNSSGLGQYTNYFKEMLSDEMEEQRS